MSFQGTAIPVPLLNILQSLSFRYVIEQLDVSSRRPSSITIEVMECRASFEEPTLIIPDEDSWLLKTKTHPTSSAHALLCRNIDAGWPNPVCSF